MSHLEAANKALPGSNSYTTKIKYSN